MQLMHCVGVIEYETLYIRETRQVTHTTHHV